MYVHSTYIYVLENKVRFVYASLCCLVMCVEFFLVRLFLFNFIFYCSVHPRKFLTHGKYGRTVLKEN